MSRLIRLVAVVVALAFMSGGARLAWARSDRVVIYAPAKVFPTAVRFLRVDAHARIIEKDADAGSVLFEVDLEGKTFPGSLELIDADANGRPAARVVIKLEGQPSYVETIMLDKLERKLRDELGPPPPAPPTRDQPKPQAPGPTPAPTPTPAPPAS